ncbi:ribosome biogenesis GTPase Der [candidate division WS5 bacterium]|uniref:GTPase Der n=1 Tax=candidate division WS5 bacterium TaxID=2093353 RepID=A0A419DA88_9BACT|nr:MAG: ribosome biogenesis GTPase Der [candidate division WS5 bacterium]
MFKVALIGKPNAGKSSLFNALIKKRKAITTNIPGTTRDWNEEAVSFDDFEFILADTAGIELKVPEGDTLKEKSHEKLEKNLKTVDLFIFVGDRETGITGEDTKIIRNIRKYGKEILLVVNKIDNPRNEANLAEFYKLGVGEPLGVSAEHKRNISILLELLANKVEPCTRFNLENITEEIKVAILGRPNVGKSSFLNKLIKEEKFIVSDIPGTTRDVNSTYVEHEGRIINFLDTAGLRRRGKIGKVPGKSREGLIEKFSAQRVKETLTDCDIALLVIDPKERITAQDLHIAGYIKDEYKGIIVVVNKWDLAKEGELTHGFDTVERFSRLAQHKFDFLPYAPIVFVSSLTGKNVPKVLDLIMEIKERRGQKISTSELNKLLMETMTKKMPVSIDKHQVNVKYVTQTGINPPEFTFFANYPEKVHFSYRRFLENRIREKWDFTGTPIKIVFKAKSKQ